jgi:hypothetical protein
MERTALIYVERTLASAGIIVANALHDTSVALGFNIGHHDAVAGLTLGADASQSDSKHTLNLQNDLLFG